MGRVSRGNECLGEVCTADSSWGEPGRVPVTLLHGVILQPGCQSSRRRSGLSDHTTGTLSGYGSNNFVIFHGFFVALVN